MKNKGITLVALIITIIVLLILATVSISLVINNNVLDKAQHGGDKYSEEEELEQIKLAVASAMLKGNGFLDTDNLNSELQDRFGNDKEVIESSNEWSFKLDKSYRIYEDGKVEESQSILPAEYQQVEYLESSGTQYIDTKLEKITKEIQIKITFSISKNTPLSIELLTLIEVSFPSTSVAHTLNKNIKPLSYILEPGVVVKL